MKESELSILKYPLVWFLIFFIHSYIPYIIKKKGNKVTRL